MSKNSNTQILSKTLITLAVIIMTVAAIMSLAKNNTTGDVIIEGSGTMAGLKCIDTTLEHPVFTDVRPSSQTNTITASFTDNALSTIMYRYEGTYKSEDEASHAKVLAEANYNLILANEYGVKIDIFTHTFMRDGDTIALTISGKADKVTSQTAPYFLLDSTKNFPKTLDELRAAYEAKGLSCTIEK